MLNTSRLSLDRAPPIAVPLRFFLAAPLYLVVAGLLLGLWGGGLVSRWSPLALALTHLLVLGFLGQIMVGALYQMLPVLVGAEVPLHRAGSLLVWGLLNLGVPLMAWGLLSAAPPWLAAGGAMVVVALGLFLLAAGIALRPLAGRTATARGMALALVCLAATLVLGTLLVAQLNGWLLLGPLPAWVERHLVMGLLGWVGLLWLGVSLQLIPMFHVTGPYPPRLGRWLAPVICGLLFAWLAPLPEVVRAPLLGLVLAGFGLFLGVTLRLLAGRKRRRRDPMLWFWWLAIGALSIALAAWLAGASPLLVGVLLLPALAVLLPAGMLLKIIPFLSWYHLQATKSRLRRLEVRLPKMNDFISPAAGWWQWRLAMALMAALVAGALGLPLAMPLAGGLLALLGALSGFHYWRAYLRHRVVARRLQGPIPPVPR